MAAAQQTNQDYSDDDDDETDHNHGYDAEQGHGRPSTPSTDAPKTKLFAAAAAQMDTLHSRNNSSRSGVKGKKKKRKNSKSSSINDNNDDNDEGDTTALLSPGAVKKGSLSFQESLVYSATRRDICCYSMCIFVNAVLIEGPLSAVEGLIRAGLFFVACFMVLLAAVLTRHGLYYTLCFNLLRECMISFAGALTLSIPFMSCFAYRRYRMDVEWKLAAIPTILGWVDCRRFMVFTYGNGSFARNVRYDGILQGDVGDIDDGGMEVGKHREAKEDNKKRLQRQKRLLDRPSLDTWRGSILLEPRRVHVNLVLIVRGEDPLGILDPQILDPQILDPQSN